MQILPCEKNRLCSKCTNFHRTPPRSPTQKAYFNIRPTSTSSPRIRISISISCRASYFFFFLFRNSLSGISVRIKRVCTERISVAVRITTCFLLHVCRIVPVLTHLAPHPYLSPRFPSLFGKKRSIGPRFFIFPFPHFGSYCLFGNPKSPRH